MSVAQGAVRSVLHDQKWSLIPGDTDIEEAHNMRMLQAEGAYLVNESPQFFRACQPDMQHFDRGQAVSMHLFAQINVTKTPSSQATPQPIVARALTDSVCPCRPLLLFCHLLNGSAHPLNHILEGIVNCGPARHRLSVSGQHLKRGEGSIFPI